MNTLSCVKMFTSRFLKHIFRHYYIKQLLACRQGQKTFKIIYFSFLTGNNIKIEYLFNKSYKKENKFSYLVLKCLKGGKR